MGRKTELEAKQLFAWGELSRYDYFSLLFIIFTLLYSHFQLVFVSIVFAGWCGHQGHSFALIDLFFICILCFGFTFWYLCFSLVNTWCIDLSLSLIYKNHAFVSYGFHLLLVFLSIYETELRFFDAWLFVRLYFASIFVPPCITLFLVSLGDDTIAMVRQPLRGLRTLGIRHHLVGMLEKYFMGPTRYGKTFPALEWYLRFLVEYHNWWIGDLITNENGEYFGLNEGPSRVYRWWPLDFEVEDVGVINLHRCMEVKPKCWLLSGKTDSGEFIPQ